VSLRSNFDTDYGSAATITHPFFVFRIGQSKKVTIIKLVSKDTVDEDIYAMQQRKTKMNAAIMGSDGEWNKESKEDKKMVLKTAVNRFLLSPKATSRPPITGHQENSQNNCENV
jgi:hypothetical protein